ncbi:MAG: PLP-dependent transferase [Opitutales bacterium]|nr:PLP-dependent transferase [Opitutales bacterium]
MLIDFPLGHSINGSPHSVCVSLPTMRDVVGYEEHDERVRGALLAGYPRFITHPLIRDLVACLRAADGLGTDERVFPVASPKAGAALLAYAGGGGVRRSLGVDFVVVKANEMETAERARAFLQHTGVGLSSREAEGVLVRLGKRPKAFAEKRAAPESAGEVVRAHLHACYGTRSTEDIYLARGGMNAFFGGFRALQKIQAARGRNLWIQLGWLYVDTIRVLEKMTGTAPLVLDRVDDLDGLRSLLREQGQRVAGIVTEVPTNPLLHTADLAVLRDLADDCGCALILDPTIVSPHNVNVLPYADLHINSLTKYACHEGDVMVGAAALNAASPFYAELKGQLEGELEAPSTADLARLAHQIGGYSDFVETVNKISLRVVDFLESHPAVRQVWWARQPGHAERFDRISHKAGGIGCVLSFAASRPLEAVYDRLRLAKSPSFGTVFSMACPFLYLAHYDLVTTAAGRTRLARAGIPHDLIRLSIGKEHPDEITGMLSEALK